MAKPLTPDDRITFACPACGVKLKAKPTHRGKVFACPKCKVPVVVPLSNESDKSPSQAVSMADPASYTETASPAKTSDGRAGAPSEDHVPDLWQPGDVILDLYEVKEVLGEGGFGKVYQVHHRGWNMDLAVKSPLPGRFQNERDKEKFVRECETWVNLGLHPHAVSCYYVRILGGIPRVFAEYVEGGNLKEWIDGGKLHLPSPARGKGAGSEGRINLALVLDIAIQIAWGMAFAHSKGLVHRDLKPANVLLTPDGTAKVTDFGLARQGAAMGEDVEALGYQVSSGAGTPGYGAPEQWSRGATVDHRADIFAFGVMLWTMLGGTITWADMGRKSVIARHAVTELVKRGEPGGLPEPLVELILRCLEPEPEDRWPDFLNLSAKLIGLYTELLYQTFPRPAPQAADLMADALNNRAISLMDLEKTAVAKQAWERALALAPDHLESVYNFGLVQWREGLMDGDAVKIRLREAASVAEPWRVALLSAQVELESDDCEAALGILNKLPSEDARRPEVASLVSRSRALLPTSRRCLRSFEGHGSVIRSVSVSADGRLGLSGSMDKTLRFWDLSAGACLRVLEGHAGAVVSAGLSADGHFALSGSEDRTLRLWDLSSGCCVQILQGHVDQVTAVCLTGDGRRGLSGSKDKTLKLWDLVTGDCLWTRKEESALSAACLSGNGRIALTRSGGALKVWEVESARCVQKLEGHATGALQSICLSSDGLLALSGGRDGRLRLFDTTSGRCMRTFAGQSNIVISVSLSSDSTIAVSTAFDKTIHLWDVSTGRCMRVFHARDFVASVCVSADGLLVLSGGRDKAISLWAAAGNSNSRAYLEPSRCVSSDTAARTTTQFRQYLTEATRAVERGDAHKAASAIRRARSLPGCRTHQDALSQWAVLYRKLPKTTFSGGWQERVFEGHADAVTCVSLSPDSRYALSGSRDKTVKLWELASGRCLQTFTGHKNPVATVCFSPDGRFALSASGDCDSYSSNSDILDQLVCWELSTGQCLWTLEGQDEKGDSVCFSPDGRYLLSGVHDAKITLWDAMSGRRLGELPLEGFNAVDKHNDNVDHHFSAEGKPLDLTRVDASSDLLDLSTDLSLELVDDLKSLDQCELGTDDDLSTANSEVSEVIALDTSEDTVATTTGFGLSPFCVGASGRVVLFVTNEAIELHEIPSGRCLRTFSCSTPTGLDDELLVDDDFLLSPLDEINAVSMTPDERLVIVQRSRSVTFWEASSGRTQGTMSFDEGYVGYDSDLCLGLSTDGHYVLSANRDAWRTETRDPRKGPPKKTMELWEVSSGRCLRIFEGHTDEVTSVALSSDGRYALSGSWDGTLRLWFLDWELEDREPADWDEGARPYVETFLTQQTPYAGSLNSNQEPTEEEIRLALTRRGKPVWTEEDFRRLLTTLGYAGYGWLRPEGVRRKLEEMAANWTGPPPLPRLEG